MTEGTTAPKKRTIELGPTGETVSRRLAELRGGMQYKQLAERLEAIGRPIPPLGLRRIEQGERRVDVDDLMALAVALGVSPLTLLLPEDASYALSSRVTGVSGEVAHNVQWLWARGEQPLDLGHHPQTHEGQQEIAQFAVAAMPQTIDKRGVAAGAGFSDSEAQTAAEQSFTRQRIGHSTQGK